MRKKSNVRRKTYKKKYQKRSRRKSKSRVKRGGSRSAQPWMRRVLGTVQPKSPYSDIQRKSELAEVAKKGKASESRKVKKLVDAKVLDQRCNKQRLFEAKVKKDSTQYERQSKVLSKKQPGGPAGDSPGNKFGKVCKQSLDKAIKPNITVESYDRAIDKTKLPYILESCGNPPYTLVESSSRRSRTADIDELPRDIRNLLLSLERKSK